MANQESIVSKIQFWWNVVYICIPIILVSYVVFNYTPNWFSLPFNIFCGALCQRMYLKVKREWR